MRKIYCKLAILANVYAIIFIFCLAMIFLGKAYPQVNGFDIDAQGKLYVGEGRMLGVYQNGIRIDTIDMKNHTYRFTIDENEDLIVAYPSVVYHMDKAGNVLRKKDDRTAETYKKLQYITRVTDKVTGDEYQIVNRIGRTRIVKNDHEVVYIISTLSFVVRILLIVGCVTLFVNVIWFVKYVRRTKKTQQ